MMKSPLCYVGEKSRAVDLIAQLIADLKNLENHFWVQFHNYK